MQIHTTHTLCFRITSANPPHDTAVAFIKAACARTNTPCNVSAMKMPEDAKLETRSSEVRIAADVEYLERLAVDLSNAMTLLGIETEPCGAE